MRTLLFIFAVACATLCQVTPARACSCMPHGSDADEVKKSDAVFVGTVTSLTTTPGRGTIAQIAVATAIKGVRPGTTVTIDAGMGGGSCGFSFERGKRYEVFADKDAHGTLSTSICSATHQVT